jgi:hypothetical protein
MAYSSVPTVATGDLWTAANHNTYIRDNFAAGIPDIFTTKGDLGVASGPDVVIRLPVGSDGQILKAASGQSAGVQWVNSDAGFEFLIDGAGAAIPTGIKGDIEVPFACTITQVTLAADQTGSIVVDIWKVAYGSYPPTAGNTITASAIPTITSAAKNQDATLTGWTKTLAAGDILRINVNSCSTITRCIVSLRVTRS